MGRIIIAITTALAVVAAVNFFTKKNNLKQEIPNPVAASWEHWKQDMGKSYGNNSEEEYRQKVFTDNWYIVQKHNEKDAKFKLNLNVFADLTREEFAKTYTGFKNTQKFTSNETVRFNTNNLKSSVNWVTEGAVAPIKNQGHCGSCWAFSTACAVESANKIGKNQSSVTPLSEQQLVDCAGGEWGNNGCHGGLMDLGFAYVKENPLATEDDYGYTGRDGTCRSDEFEGVGTVSGFTDVSPGEPDQLRAALNQQPVSVAIEADQSIFQLYHSGVITSECGQQLDHGVVAVGYGNEDGEDYFLVRNSWGEGWGDAGYVKIGASEDNVCGILSKASYPRA